MILRLKRKACLLLDDPHMREIARGTLLAFVLKVVGSGLAFAFNVAVARLLGVEGMGLYYLALAVTTIGSVVGRIGLDNTLLRFVATSATHEDWASVKGVYALGMRMAVIASGMVTLIVFFAAPWITATLFKKPELAEPLRWMSLSIFPFALSNLQAESLKGVKRIRDAMMVQGIGVPLVGLILIYPLAEFYGVLGVALAYLAGTVAAVALGMSAWRKAMPKNVAISEKFSIKVILSSCQPLFAVSLMNNVVLAWMPVILLGMWASIEEVGVFGAASRFVSLTTMMLFTANNVLAPKIAELYAKGDMEILSRTARWSAMLTALFSAPIFVALIFCGDWVMGIFGKQFEQGALILAILTVGQVVNVFAGVLGTILIVSGNEKYTRNATFISTLVLIILLLVLTPVFGGIGAALAVSISGTWLSVVSVMQAQRIVGFRVIPLLK